VALASGTSLAVYSYDVTDAILGDFGSSDTTRPKVVLNYLSTCADVSFGSINPCVSDGFLVSFTAFNVSTCQPPTIALSDIQTIVNLVADDCSAQGHDILSSDRSDGAQKYFDVVSNSGCWANLCEDGIIQSLESSWIATCANVQLPFPLPVADMFISASTLQRDSILTCMLDYVMDTPATTFGLVNPPLESPLNCYPPGVDSLETDCPAIGQASFDECILKFEGNNTDLTNAPIDMSFSYIIQDHEADIIFDFCGLLDELTTASARECLLELCAFQFSPPTSAAPSSSAPVVPPSRAPTGQPTDDTVAPTTIVPTSTATPVPATPAPVTKAPTKDPVVPVTPAPVTKAPTMAPTKAPVVPVTPAPVTKAPTMAPTKAPVVPVTPAPVTNAPTKAPTRNPVVSLTPVPTRPPTSVAPTKAPTTTVPSSVPSAFPSFKLVQAIASARCLSSFTLDNVTVPVDTSLFNSFVGRIESSIYNVIADLNGNAAVTVIQLNGVSLNNRRLRSLEDVSSALEVHFEVAATRECFVSRRQCEYLAVGISSEYNSALMNSVQSGTIGASLRANSAVFGVAGLLNAVAVKDSFTVDNTYSYVTDVPVDVESEPEIVITSSAPAAFRTTLIVALVSLSLFLA
jgi:hypothetical protein